MHRTGSGMWVLAASLATCAAGGLVVGGAAWLARAATAEGRSWRSAEQLEDHGRAVLARLETARSDLAGLGASSAVIASHGRSSGSGLVQHLRGFLTNRPWCRSVFVAPVDGGPLLVLRQRGDGQCDLGHAEDARLLPDSDGFLAPGSGGTANRLCLGVAVEGATGRGVAVLAEVDPAALFGGLLIWLEIR